MIFVITKAALFCPYLCTQLLPVFLPGSGFSFYKYKIYFYPTRILRETALSLECLHTYYLSVKILPNFLAVQLKCIFGIEDFLILLPVLAVFHLNFWRIFLETLKFSVLFAWDKLFTCLFYFECELLEGRAGKDANCFLATYLTYPWLTFQKGLESKQIWSQKAFMIPMRLFKMESAALLCFQNFVLRRPQIEISCTGENIHCSLQRGRDTLQTQVLLKCFYEPPWGLHIPLYGACCYQQCFEKSYLLACLYSFYVHACNII